jgi:hypothetical protein
MAADVNVLGDASRRCIDDKNAAARRFRDPGLAAVVVESDVLVRWVLADLKIGDFLPGARIDTCGGSPSMTVIVSESSLDT